MPLCVTTNVSPHLGVVRVVANSRVISHYPVVVVWKVLIILETQHLL